VDVAPLLQICPRPSKGDAVQTGKKMLSRFAICLGFLMVFWGLLCRDAAADTNIISMQYVSGDWTAKEVAELSASAFTDLHQGQSQGFIDGPIWVKIVLGERRGADTQFLAIRPIHLDSVEIYSRDSLYRPLYRGGDTMRSPISYLRNGYTVHLPDDVFGNSLFVRLESRNIMQPVFAVLPLSEILRLEQVQSISFTIAFAATLFYLLWAASTVLMHPSLLLGSYIVRLVCYLAVLLIHSGTLRVLTSSDSIAPQDFAHNFSALLYITLAQLFDYMLLRQLRGTWGPRLFLLATVMFGLAKFVVFAGGDVSLALQLNNLSALITLCLGFAASFAARSQISGVFGLSRLSIGIYFILQAVPLAALMLANILESAHFRAIMEVAFLNYSIFPGAYVTYLLFRRQRWIVREQRILSDQQKILRAEAKAEIAKRTEIGNLLQMLTHEVKTPLATLQMAQTVGALDEHLVGKAVKTITHVLQQCDRVDEIESGQLKIEVRPTDLPKALRTASDDTQIGIQVVSANTPLVMADPNLLQIVLNNLLNNAAKYRKAGTPIVATYETQSDCVTLYLSNRCRPPTLPDPKRMFIKYYRHSNTEAQPGTGLGLYIVAQLCHRMGVNVHAELDGDMLSIVLRFPIKE
jgi:signal transduction histidine kinase